MTWRIYTQYTPMWRDIAVAIERDVRGEGRLLDTLTALHGTAVATNDVSDDFLLHVPREAALVRQRLQSSQVAA